MALGMALLQDSVGGRFLMREVSLQQTRPARSNVVLAENTKRNTHVQDETRLVSGV